MKKRIYVLLTAVTFLLLAGCGTDRELTAFHDRMDSFYHALSTAVAALENIDPASETAVDEVLASLDEMNLLFEDLASVAVPDDLKDQFENVETLADEAADCMSEANGFYHEAYAGGGYDDAAAQTAWEYYSRAMKRINYIAVILQGRLPEGDDITVISEEETTDWNGGEPALTEPTE